MANSPLDILVSYEQKIIDSLIKSLEENDRVVKGGLAQSITVSFKAFATSFVVEISMLKYWKQVDEGRKSGGKMPPIGDLKNGMLKHIADRGERYSSIVKKLQNTYKNKKGIEKKRKSPISADKARKQLAWGISKNIQKKGVKPTFFIEEALDNSVFNDLTRDLSAALAREITITLDLK